MSKNKTQINETTEVKNKTHYEKRTLNFADWVRFMALIRSSELTLPAMLCLSIVNDNASARYPMVFPGEVECVYRSIVARRQNDIWNDVMDAYPEDVRGWTYSTIRHHLSKLADAGFLNKEREGRYVAYGMSEKGVRLLVKLFGEEADKSPKKKRTKKNVSSNGVNESSVDLAAAVATSDTSKVTS